MRTFAIIFSLLFSFCLLAEQKMLQLETDPSLYYYPPSAPQTKPQGEPQKEDKQEEGDIAQGRSNEFEYNLYDRQQNRRDQNQRQQQQYYYQQSGGNGNGNQNNGTQMRRVKKAPSTQYFNPRDE